MEKYIGKDSLQEAIKDPNSDNPEDTADDPEDTAGNRHLY